MSIVDELLIAGHNRAAAHITALEQRLAAVEAARRELLAWAVECRECGSHDNAETIIGAVAFLDKALTSPTAAEK